MRTFSWMVVSTLMYTHLGMPQSPAPIKPPLAWASISIHVTDPNAKSNYIEGLPIGDSSDQPNGITEHNMSLREIISNGYNFSVFPFREDEITGLPEWARTQRYDILARVDADDVPAFKKLSNLPMKDTIAAFAARQPTGEMLMMQSLLQERFHLSVHWEMKQRSAFNLVVAKGGLRLKPPSTDPDHGEINFSRGHLSGKGVPLSFLASVLAMPVGHTIIDTTGLTGSYDFDLHFTPADVPTDTPGNDPDIYTAVQEQLGLKLQSTHAAVPILIVDHIDHPTPN